MARKSFKWSGDLEANLAKMPYEHQRAMTAAAAYTASATEAYMKQNAPWTDRTGAARNGLGAKVYTSATKVAVVLYHSVDYGIWLELRWGGKYAIIRPALQWGSLAFMKATRKLFEG